MASLSMLSPKMSVFSILSISIVFNTPIILTGSVADINDPYANETTNGND